MIPAASYTPNASVKAIFFYRVKSDFPVQRTSFENLCSQPEYMYTQKYRDTMIQANGGLK